MSWIFSLSAECGKEQTAAEQFSDYFDRVSWILSNNNQSQCQTGIFQDIEDNWWCRVTPTGISEVGINTPETAYIMTEVGILLYQHLRFAPTFRYALVGLEVDEFRTYSELLEDTSSPSFPGLVLAETIWQLLGAPSDFRSFSSGYVWKPYQGEVYQPLMVSSDLKNKLNELLNVG
ncbi:hypothetical protein ACE1CI_15950 [Aerosakkonemataceae cyanobacterium BLCC-F50]|uniref:Uncharacterized protein n=1 Tax=Floridaenema flaviceps BLCC-F50 TaxID=3153642 RepID=A0ABV4XSH4_9CYAN